MLSSKARFGEITMSDAQKWSLEIDTMDEASFGALEEKWRKHDVEVGEMLISNLRKKVVFAFQSSGGDSLNTRKMYPVDVAVGIELFRCLDELGCTVVDACNDDFWRWLTIGVFPDLTYMRYPDPDAQAKKAGGRLNRKRFFAHTRRIWLKTLWWYVYLSWQGDAETTSAVLCCAGTDAISQFIERTGRGYRLDLYREFMRQYSLLPDGCRSDALFKAATKLNGAECRLVEPALTSGGVEGYCKCLFTEVVEARKNKEEK